MFIYVNCRNFILFPSPISCYIYSIVQSYNPLLNTSTSESLVKNHRQIIQSPAASRPSPQVASVNSAPASPSLVLQIPVARLSRRSFVRLGPSSRRGTFGVLGFLVACAPGDQPPIVSASVPPSQEHSGDGVSGGGRIEGLRGCKRVIRDQAQCRHQA